MKRPKSTWEHEEQVGQWGVRVDKHHAWLYTETGPWRTPYSEGPGYYAWRPFAYVSYRGGKPRSAHFEAFGAERSHELSELVEAAKVVNALMKNKRADADQIFYARLPNAVEVTDE